MPPANAIGVVAEAYFIPPAEYKARWDAADAPTDHQLVQDHSQCQGFWPECKETHMNELSDRAERMGGELNMAFRPGSPGGDVGAIHSYSHPGMEKYVDFGLFGRLASQNGTPATAAVFDDLTARFPAVFTPWGNGTVLGGFTADLTTEALDALKEAT